MSLKVDTSLSDKSEILHNFFKESNIKNVDDNLVYLHILYAYV